ncbi:TPR-like protein [Yamadazyma tenuis ATCC 10573]|uniref:TPR-like protein n=1 Tax=Candida tenuis (strain ATCC 10573 / BCRC 21748 / CBS 615 / JCM 9827 / NBRC 10315 / NRRL Y-1498 / VKM Y-70) TaxID=590646 RepID=G3AY80_CANTC|nr:TPR-like protein [Yamadazyma tenuis ATCC 10573]EGV65785.1 TPR-like protein [Yamadazyma tenuis ATCC 10573]
MSTNSRPVRRRRNVIHTDDIDDDLHKLNHSTRQPTLEEEEEYEESDYYEDTGSRNNGPDPSDDEFGTFRPPEFDSGEDESYTDDSDARDEFYDHLRAANNLRPRAKGKENDPEVLMNLEMADTAFVHEDYDEAVKYYSEVVRIDPKHVRSYRILGDIAKSRGKLNDCCTYWFLAAVNSEWDGQLWSMVADLSASLGHTTQAIKAYGKAIGLRTEDRSRLMLERSLLYKKTRQFGRALDGFRKLCSLDPTNREYIKELASIYVQDRRENDAINLYMDIFDKNIHKGGKTNEPFPEFRWEDLNILAELYITKRAWKPALRVILLASRFLQNRLDEYWWDNHANDAEFEEEKRKEVLAEINADPSFYDREVFLPIDIRYKLGQVRLELDQKDEAMKHFHVLLDEDNEEEIADLLLEAGKCLEMHGYFSDALIFLTRAVLYERTSDIDTVILLANCYFEVGDYAEARDAYEAVLNATPDDMTIKLSLAEALYRLSDIKQAEELLAEVAASRKKLTQESIGAKELKEVDITEEREETGVSIFLETRPVKLTKKPTEDEKIAAEEASKRKVLETFRRMQRLQDDITKGEPIAINAWMQSASRLIEMFMSVPNFFPRDKNRTFKGIVSYRRKKPMEIDERIARVYNLFEGMSIMDNNSRSFLTSEKEFRGLDYDSWFMIFIQYVLLEARFKNDLEYATSLIEVAGAVSVFVQDKNKSAIIRLVKLSFGIATGDYLAMVMTYVRYFLTGNQFSPFIYKLFLCCFASGTDAWEAFSNYNHQKFFLRQLKAYDSVCSGKKITGMATISADIKGLKFKNEHCELLYIYSNLLGGNRNFISPLVYLSRVYLGYDQDPMVCLTLGLAHVHRSMQRLSANRHMQLLQGISYVMQYRELRLVNSTIYEEQEVEFNIGKLFHMIGLVSEAVVHYNKVLEYHDQLINDPDYDMSVEAAYNLALIYNLNGNSALARELTEKYLTI